MICVNEIKTASGSHFFDGLDGIPSSLPCCVVTSRKADLSLTLENEHRESRISLIAFISSSAKRQSLSCGDSIAFVADQRKPNPGNFDGGE